MKHLVGFFLPLCIFSFIAFGISVAVLGIEDNAIRPEAALNSATTVLNDEYSRIEVTSTFGNLHVFPNDNDSTVIVADETIMDNVSAYVKDNTLHVICTNAFDNGFSFSDLFKGIDAFNNRNVTVYVPEKTYDALYAKNGSGNTKILNVAAMISSMDSGSGTIIYAQPDDFRSEQISVNIGSGTSKIYNADTHNYNIEIGSGNVNMFGLTGKGNIDVSSGNCKLNYKELNGDVMIDIGSGNIDMNFPKGISAEVIADIGSGDVEIDYYDADTDVDDGERFTINGGDHKITIEMGSGNVDITDEVEYLLPDLPTLPPVIDTASPVVTSAVTTTMIPDDGNMGVHVGDDGVDVDLGPIDVDVDDDHVDVNVGPIGVDVDEDKVKVEIGDLKVDIG